MEELVVCMLLLVCVFRMRRDLYKIRRSHKLLKVDLNPPEQSAWRRIRDMDTDRGYVIYTTFTRAAFNKLFAHVFPEDTMELSGDVRVRRGRPQTLTQRDYLAMTLFYLHSVATENVIASLFNCSVSTCSRNIQLTLHRLQDRLSSLPEARIKWPSEVECAMYSEMILANMVRKGNSGVHVGGYPIGFMDGCGFPVLRHVNQRIADRYFVNWKHGHNVANLFVWAPDGTLIHAIYNAPGAQPDSVLASQAYRKICEMTGAHKWTVLADSAFARHGGRIITTQAMELLSKEPHLRERNKQIASQRIAAEWGNQQLQGAFVRLTVPLPTDEDRRKQIIGVCLHLHNFRVRVDHISQIRTVYDPNWLGNWRYGAPGLSNHERYIESVRLRHDRFKRKAEKQRNNAAKRRRNA